MVMKLFVIIVFLLLQERKCHRTKLASLNIITRNGSSNIGHAKEKSSPRDTPWIAFEELLRKRVETAVCVLPICFPKPSIVSALKASSLKNAVS
jgi:hypothetical protein